MLGSYACHFFRGTFFYCDRTNIFPQGEVVTSQDCMDFGGDWINNTNNFDNIGRSMVNIFQMCTTEGWIQIMQAATDSIGVNIDPITNVGKYWSLYFIVNIIIANFLMLNFFGSVVIETFNQERDRQGGLLELTGAQKEWIHLQEHILS
jgi:hypothetical protein